MEWEKFTCCQKNPRFETTKNGYKCKDCGRFFLRKSLDYYEKNIPFNKLNYQTKIRGRKAEYIKNADNSVFSTLETGKVNLMSVGEKNMLLDKKSIEVKKAVLMHTLNFNNTFLTITENGVIDVYDMENGKAISQYKSRRDYCKMEVFPLGKKGNWLYIDTEKIICFSCDFKKNQTVLCFDDVVGNEILSIRSVDHNTEYDCFVIHVTYVLKKVDGQPIMRCSIVFEHKDDVFDVRIFKYGAGNELTYDFEKDMYYGIYHDKMVKMDDDSKFETICKIPTVRSYSDGGGVFWVEEFIRSPEKLYFLTDNIIILRYDWEIVILDIQKQEVIDAIEGRLIQSFFIMDPNTICFSAGLNTYIVEVNYDQDS